MPSKRTLRARSPHKPITPEILELFDRNLELRDLGANDDDAPEHLHDEYIAVRKKLVWSLLPRIFGEHWGPHSPSPADPVLDDECFAGEGCQLHIDWPDLQRDRRILLAALAEWKQRKAL
jgi:hypothetical protein